MLQLPFHRIFCEIVITAQNFKKPLFFKKDYDNYNFLLHSILKPYIFEKITVFMLQLPFHRIFCEIVITAQNFKKPSFFKKIDEFKNQRIPRIPLQYVELLGLSFETGPSSKITILTTFFRKNENIGVQILQTVLCYYSYV